MTIYFYKVYDPYGCFSNFSPHEIYCEGLSWLSVEHYYQAHKFQNTQDEWLMGKIHDVSTPEEAASIGRNPQYQVRGDWEEIKRNIMWQGVLTKFTNHLDIQKILLDTKDEIIVENSPTDYYWGCGNDNTGRNELGKILMRVRDYLKNS